MGIRNTEIPETTVYSVMSPEAVRTLVLKFLRKMNFSKKFIRLEEADALQDILERLITRTYNPEKAKPVTLIYMVVSSYITNLYKSRRVREAALTVHNDYVINNNTYEDIPDFYEAESNERSYFVDTNMSALDRLIAEEEEEELLSMKGGK